eukprot:jgi/Chrpa1/18268/Chrysochromulina_OHIO_Genome00005661-RA
MCSPELALWVSSESQCSAIVGEPPEERTWTQNSAPRHGGEALGRRAAWKRRMPRATRSKEQRGTASLSIQKVCATTCAASSSSARHADWSGMAPCQTATHAPLRAALRKNEP